MKNLSDLTDEELIRSSRRSNHAAYRELVERYKEAGYRLATHILRHPSDAEDALQEAFTKAYIYLDSYDPSYRFYTWFATIVRNVAFSHLKARDWIVTPETEQMLRAVRSTVDDSPELAALASSRADMVRQAVNVLPERYRRVLVLRYWHELSYEEIARATEQSLAAVKTQIHRAKQMLGEGLLSAEPSLATE